MRACSIYVTSRPGGIISGASLFCYCFPSIISFSDAMVGAHDVNVEPLFILTIVLRCLIGVVIGWTRPSCTLIDYSSNDEQFGRAL